MCGVHGIVHRTEPIALSLTAGYALCLAECMLARLSKALKCFIRALPVNLYYPMGSDVLN